MRGKLQGKATTGHSWLYLKTFICSCSSSFSFASFLIRIQIFHNQFDSPLTTTRKTFLHTTQ
jgi:hypothetical protein